MDSWVAAMLSRRERQAATWALRRASLGRGGGYSRHMSPADARDVFAVVHPLEEGMQ